MANEKRLIDANALQDEIRKSKDGHRHLDHKIAVNHHMEHDVFLELVDYAPTVDAVEVVRCKECKHYVAPQGTYVCDCFEGLNFATDNDFCSYGERRKGK